MAKRMPASTTTLFVVLGLGLALAQPALAQPRNAVPPAPAAPAGAPAAAAAAPERTVSQYGDWSMTCAQPANQPRRCEVGLSMQDQQRRIGAAVAFGRTNKESPMRIVMQVPVNARVSAPMRVVLEANEVTLVPFAACTPGGCFAELELRDDVMLRRMRARNADAPGRIEWKDAGGNDVALPLPVRGFAAAMDALARETH